VRLLKTAWLTLLILSLSTLAAFAQTSAQTPIVKPAIVDATMLFRGPMPAVEVMVNGQGPFIFAIDTGAEGSARVDSSLMERLKLKAIGQRQAGDGSGRNVRTLDVVQLDSISFGGVQFKDVRAVTRDYNASSSLPRIDGILGFNLFADYLLTLDFPAQRVRLERGALPQANGVEIISFDSERGIPVVELRVGNHKINAHIDSGNTAGGFILPTSLAEKLTFANAPVSLGKARTVSNEVEVKEVRLKENINLGRSEFKEPTIIFPALSDDANIGMQVLREFALTFDQKNKRLRLERRELPKAAEKSVVGSARDFKDYPGRYGARTVTLEGDALFLQREGGLKLKLMPVAKDEFALERFPEARIKFIRGEKGGVAELHVLNRDGAWEKSPKEQP
jgi:predicted aspartyl protease